MARTRCRASFPSEVCARRERRVSTSTSPCDKALRAKRRSFSRAATYLLTFRQKLRHVFGGALQNLLPLEEQGSAATAFSEPLLRLHTRAIENRRIQQQPLGHGSVQREAATDFVPLMVQGSAERTAPTAAVNRGAGARRCAGV